MEIVIEKKKLSDEAADRRFKRWIIHIRWEEKLNVLKAKWMLIVSYE